jgi:hypothetical protein
MTGNQSRIESTNQKTTEADSIRHVPRMDSHAKTCRSARREESRLVVSPDAIEAYFHRFIATLDGIPIHLVLSVGEMVAQVRTDRKAKRVTDQQSILVTGFSSPFRDAAREPFLWLPSALMYLF